MKQLNILFLAANPTTTIHVDLEEELRILELELRGVKHRGVVKLTAKHAVRPDDLLRHVRDIRPNILHFSGHGTAGGLLLRSDEHACEDGVEGVGCGAIGEAFTWAWSAGERRVRLCCLVHGTWIAGARRGREDRRTDSERAPPAQNRRKNATNAPARFASATGRTTCRGKNVGMRLAQRLAAEDTMPRSPQRTCFDSAIAALGSSSTWRVTASPEHP